MSGTRELHVLSVYGVASSLSVARGGGGGKGVGSEVSRFWSNPYIVG